MTLKRLSLLILLINSLFVLLFIKMTDAKAKYLKNLLNTATVVIQKCQNGPHQIADVNNIIVPKTTFATVDVYIDKSRKGILTEQRYYQDGKLIAIDHLDSLQKIIRRDVFDYYKQKARLRLHIDFDKCEKPTQIIYFDEDGKKIDNESLVVLPCYTGGY